MKNIQKRNIDKIILWTLNKPSEEVLQFLKDNNIDIIYTDLEEIFSKNMILSYFIPDFYKDELLNICVHRIVEILVKRLKKIFHLILSEIAAPIYDKKYGKAKFATKAIMDFEEEKLKEVIKKIERQNRKIAVDIGCGTGRHSFILSKEFDLVYGIDFSPKMIEVAERKKRESDINNIIFSIADFEYEEIPDEGDFYGQVDLIVASFGMGSFIEDTPQMLRRFYDWLKPGGYLFLSFYNGNSILKNIVPNWRNTSLSAHLDIDNNTLEVQLTPELKFKIFCKPFTETTKGEINKIFNIENIYFYPTIMSIMPNDLLEENLAYKLFNYIDRNLAFDKKFNLGYYVIVIAHKPYFTLKGYETIVKLLKSSNYKYEVIEHGPVLSVKDVQKELTLKGYNIDKSLMIKTVVFKNRKNNKFIVVVLPANKRINKELLAKFFKIPVSKIGFATEKEIIKLGFPVGGIAPFGFSEADIIELIDNSIENIPNNQWIYTGIGDNRKTLRIKAKDFKKIISEYEKINF